MDRKKVSILLIIIISLGILLRVSSVFLIPFEEVQMDIGIKTDLPINYEKVLLQDRDYLYSNGTLDYVLQIFNNHKLYQNNILLAYHPPLFFAMCSLILYIASLFTTSAHLMLLSTEFFVLILSLLSILLFTKIMKELEFSSKETILPLSLAFFIPLHIYMSRLITNDQLVILFSLLLLLCLIRWYKDPNIKHIIFGALALGLGGMAKTSIVVMLIPMGYVFFKKIYEVSKANETPKLPILYKHLIVLILIASPLFLWYPTRNYVLFDQPLFYVTAPDKTLAVESTNFVDRWLINKDFISDNHYATDSNVPFGAIKLTIVFDTLPTSMNSFVQITLSFLILVIIILSIAGMFKGQNKYKDILVVTTISWIISFIYFNIRFPYSCTYHPRYIVLSMYIAYIFIQLLMNKTKNSLAKKCILIFTILTIIFSILSYINMTLIY